MKLTEALGILKKNGALVTEGRMTDHGYRWGGYMFNRGTKDTKWVQVLNLLYWSNRSLGMKKNQVHDWMGWSTDHSNHSSMWTELAQEGLVKYNKTTQMWKITDAGVKKLEDNDLVIPFEELTDTLQRKNDDDELEDMSRDFDEEPIVHEVPFTDSEKSKFVDDDDDMYDNTPIVKRRDESFREYIASHYTPLHEARRRITKRIQRG